jgi:hypothetical protein
LDVRSINQNVPNAILLSRYGKKFIHHTARRRIKLGSAVALTTKADSGARSEA